MARLWVLQFRDPNSARLLSQEVRFEEPPALNKCFRFQCPPSEREERTAPVRTEPQQAAPGEIYFATDKTPYLLTWEEHA